MMNTRRALALLLGAYAVLTGYIYFRAWLGLPFQIGVAFAHPLVAMVFVLLHAGQREGWRNAIRFVLLTLLLTLIIESIGVSTGFPFGHYHYTDKLGALFLGLVPYVIPIVWLNMLYPAYVIATRLFPHAQRGKHPWSEAALGGLVMTSWDLIVDPVMVRRDHWVWEHGGAYFGIPLSNFLGWWLTSFVILSLYAHRRSRHRDDYFHSTHDNLAVAIYAITGLGNVIGGMVEGLTLPALIAFLAMAFWVIMVWRTMRREVIAPGQVLGR